VFNSSRSKRRGFNSENLYLRGAVRRKPGGSSPGFGTSGIPERGVPEEAERESLNSIKSEAKIFAKHVRKVSVSSDRERRKREGKAGIVLGFVPDFWGVWAGIRLSLRNVLDHS